MWLILPNVIKSEILLFPCNSKTALLIKKIATFCSLSMLLMHAINLLCFSYKIVGQVVFQDLLSSFLFFILFSMHPIKKIEQKVLFSPVT